MSVPRSLCPRRRLGSRRFGDCLLGAVVVGLVGFYLRKTVHYGANYYDEGLIAYGAEKVLHGCQPLLDFYTPYPPGAFYAVALAFHLFGVRLLIERRVGALMVLAIAACSYGLLVRRHGERPITPIERLLACATAVTVGVLQGLQWITPVSQGALALLLLSGIMLLLALPARKPVGSFVTGLLLGLLLLWRLDFGLAGLVAAGLAWLLCIRFGQGASEENFAPAPGAHEERRHHAAGRLLRTGPRSRLAVAGVLALGVGAALVAGPPLAWLLIAGGKRAVDSLLWWPLVSTQALASALPWPPLVPPPPPPGLAPFHALAYVTANWPYYFPLLALELAAWRLTRWRTVTPREIIAGLWLLSIAIPLWIYASRLTNYVHVLPLLTVSLLFAALIVNGGLAGTGKDRLTRRTRAWCVLGPAGFVLGLALLWVSPIFNWIVLPRPEDPGISELPGPRGTGIYASSPTASRYAKIIPALRRVVPTGGRIFSGTPRHDLFIPNDVLLYFLAERDTAVYCWCLEPGVTTTEGVQRELVRELEANHAQAVVLEQIDETSVGRGRADRCGAKLLDHYLATHYRAVPGVAPAVGVRFYELRVRVASPQFAAGGSGG